MNLFFESKISQLFTGFNKNHKTQNALLNVIEKWEYKVVTIFMDLSKGFDTYNLWHNLLLAKLNACGFSFNAMKIVQRFLREPVQTVTINNNFS